MSTQPLDCPSCHMPLTVIKWTVHEDYTFNPEHDSYDGERYHGSGYSACGECGADVSALPEFEQGPVNYKHSVAEPEAKVFKRVASPFGDGKILVADPDFLDVCEDLAKVDEAKTKLREVSP